MDVERRCADDLRLHNPAVWFRVSDDFLLAVPPRYRSELERARVLVPAVTGSGAAEVLVVVDHLFKARQFAGKDLFASVVRHFLSRGEAVLFKIIPDRLLAFVDAGVLAVAAVLAEIGVLADLIVGTDLRRGLGLDLKQDVATGRRFVRHCALGQLLYSASRRGSPRA